MHTVEGGALTPLLMPPGSTPPTHLDAQEADTKEPSQPDTEMMARKREETEVRRKHGGEPEPTWCFGRERSMNGNF